MNDASHRGAEHGGNRPAPESIPTMHVRALDWLLAGSTVALGLALIGAPFAVSPRVSSLYALHGALEGAPLMTRWMLSAWFPPLLALVPTALAVYVTVTHMTQRRRRLVLVASLLAALAASFFFVRALVAPLLSAAAGAS